MPKFRFTEIAINSTEKKKPVEEDKFTYIGLEHLDSGTLTVSRWGSDIAPIGEKLVMKKGDVLFGKRRAYQKKVGIAPFDGIFSAHGMVLRPREEVITKEYFPLFISSDYFLNESIRISVGSLSPTVNWKDLKDLEFTIPSIEEQKRITPLIWAAIEAKNAYKEQIRCTDDLVKSQFIEMFGDETGNEHVISDLFTLQMGKPPERKEPKYWNSNDYRWISIADLGEYGKYTGNTKEYISQEAVDKSGIKLVPKNTVIMSFKLTIGRTAITSENIYTNEAIMAFLPKKDVFNLDYLRHALGYKDWTAGMQIAVKGATLNKDIIGRATLPIPQLALQQKFAAFAEQSDKSKLLIEYTVRKIRRFQYVYGS